jgi:type I restriction enzyme, S subunit
MTNRRRNLLKRIQAEKARLVKEGNARKEKSRVPLSADKLPFPLPVGWQWSQLAEIGLISPRNDVDGATLVSFVPMTFIPADYGIPHKHEVRPWCEIKTGYTHFAEGDVGLAKITPCFENGKSTVFRGLTGGFGGGTTELHVVRPLLVDADYVLLFLKCPHFIDSGIPRMTGTAGQKRVPADYFANSPFPLPPLAEQHRIVAKVDELMALCDQLEAAKNEREATARPASGGQPAPHRHRPRRRTRLQRKSKAPPPGATPPAFTSTTSRVSPLAPNTSSNCAKPSSTSPSKAASFPKTPTKNRLRNCLNV